MSAYGFETFSKLNDMRIPSVRSFCPIFISSLGNTHLSCDVLVRRAYRLAAAAAGAGGVDKKSATTRSLYCSTTMHRSAAPPAAET